MRRRDFIVQSTGGVFAAAAFPPAFGVEPAEAADVSDVMTTLSTFMAGAAPRELPAPLVGKTKFMILDTLAAMISGADLPPGPLSPPFARACGRTPLSTV